MFDLPNHCNRSEAGLSDYGCLELSINWLEITKIGFVFKINIFHDPLNARQEKDPHPGLCSSGDEESGDGPEIALRIESI